MCATYRDKQKRSHFESFANKIFTGIREIKPEYAEKRAIWELFQNALDTVDENGVIEIAKTERGLLFKHNGRPFKDDEFGGLIKQFSVGKTYGDNKDKLGQYGSGFISTHVYGKKIIVNGSIQTDDGTYRTLKDFELDREANSIEELTDKLLNQDERVEKLCDDAEKSESSFLHFTSFEYHASKENQIHIDGMLKYIELLLPFVFCFNDKLKEVKVLHNTYVKTEQSNGIAHVTKNGTPISIPIIQNDKKNVRVIIGDENRVLINIPKQFLFYPLMETGNAGYNFIVHASDFKPNKERDYLHLDHGNVELKNDVKTNESLLKTAFDLVLQQVRKDELLSFMDVACIEFTEHDSEFEKKLKSDYVSSIKNLERLDIGSRKCALNYLQYLDESILLLDQDNKYAIYSLLTQFRNLPPFDQYCELSQYVNNWNAFVDEKFDILTLTDISEIISAEGQGNYVYIKDKKSFQKFVSQISPDISLLNRLALVPNIHGDFKRFESLVKWESDEPELVKIVDNINASISEKYIHPDFVFLENLTSYNREKYKDDFSKFCNDLTENISKGKEELTLDSTRFLMLIENLKNFVGLNKKTQLNIDIVAFYERVFKLTSHLAELSDPTVNVNYQPAIKLLANLYVKRLAKVEVKNCIADLMAIVSVMFKNTNLKEELLHRLACIPNQNYTLKSQTELKRDDVKDEDFKSKYDEITSNSIRDELAYAGFEEFLQHSGSVSGFYLGGIIESTLDKDKSFIPVDNTTIDTVLKLIEKISEKPSTWGQWLPSINGVKEEILMHKFKDGKIRASLFSILTKNEKTIELLGDLSKIANLEDLIRKGKERQLEEARQSYHQSYISYIGLAIQDLIQKQLSIELASIISVLKSEEDQELTTQEEQNGQDFIIYKNQKPIYYLEVKSKWDENGRFALSKNQTERCASQKEKYAVISVNVDRYKRTHTIDIDNIPFEDLKDFVKVNDDLSEDFEKLIRENVTKLELNDPKLIDYRGSIPQKVIDDDGVPFDFFIQKLIEKIRTA